MKMDKIIQGEDTKWTEKPAKDVSLEKLIPKSSAME